MGPRFFTARWLDSRLSVLDLTSTDRFWISCLTGRGRELPLPLHHPTHTLHCTTHTSLSFRDHKSQSPYPLRKNHNKASDTTPPPLLSSPLLPRVPFNHPSPDIIPSEWRTASSTYFCTQSPRKHPNHLNTHITSLHNRKKKETPPATQICNPISRSY